MQRPLQVDGTPPRRVPPAVSGVTPCRCFAPSACPSRSSSRPSCPPPPRPAPPPPPPPALGPIHTVAPGETLWGIATASGLSTRAVAAANGLSPEARVV